MKFDLALKKSINYQLSHFGSDIVAIKFEHVSRGDCSIKSDATSSVTSYSILLWEIKISNNALYVRARSTRIKFKLIFRLFFLIYFYTLIRCSWEAEDLLYGKFFVFILTFRRQLSLPIISIVHNWQHRREISCVCIDKQWNFKEATFDIVADRMCENRTETWN